MAEAPGVAAVDPLAALLARFPAPAGDGVRLTACSGCGMATLMARSGRGAALRDHVAATLGLVLPDGPKASFNDGLTAIGTGPDTWLLVRDEANAIWAEELAADLAGVASLVDQSSAYAVIEIAGENARRLLQRGVFIDLHPESFATGSAAVTLLAHMGLVLWQTDDEPRYRAAIFRSFAGSFWHWIETAALGLAQRG